MNTPFQMLIMMFAGWVNEHQRIVIAYLQEENRVLRGLHGKKRLRFNNDRRRWLAAKRKALGRRVLREIGTLVTPDTILRWHRELIARTYDGSEGRRPGRPGIAQEIRWVLEQDESGRSAGSTRLSLPLPKATDAGEVPTISGRAPSTRAVPAPIDEEPPARVVAALLQAGEVARVKKVQRRGGDRVHRTEQVRALVAPLQGVPVHPDRLSGHKGSDSCGVQGCKVISVRRLPLGKCRVQTIDGFSKIDDLTPRPFRLFGQPFGSAVQGPLPGIVEQARPAGPAGDLRVGGQPFGTMVAFMVPRRVGEIERGMTANELESVDALHGVWGSAGNGHASIEPAPIYGASHQLTLSSRAFRPRAFRRRARSVPRSKGRATSSRRAWVQTA